MREKKKIQSNNRGRFYKYVNSKLSNKSGVGMLKNEDGVLITDDVERAKLLNNFFCSTNSKDNGVMPCMEPPALSSKLDTVATAININININTSVKGTSTTKDQLL